MYTGVGMRAPSDRRLPLRAPAEQVPPACTVQAREEPGELRVGQHHARALEEGREGLREQVPPGTGRARAWDTYRLRARAP